MRGGLVGGTLPLVPVTSESRFLAVLTVTSGQSESRLTVAEGGAFVAIAVDGRHGKVAAAGPRQDGGIDVLRAAYADGNDVGRILRVDGAGVRGIDDVGGSVFCRRCPSTLPIAGGCSLRLSGGGEPGGRSGRDAVGPCHGRLQGRAGIEVVQQGVVEVLCIVRHKLHPIVGFAGQVVVAYEVDLPLNLVELPVAFAGVEEVDTQAGNHVAAVALLLPVERKGVEGIAAEVHHGINLVLDAFTQPSLHILVDYMEGIPSLGRVAARVAVLAYGQVLTLTHGFSCFTPLYI